MSTMRQMIAEALVILILLIDMFGGWNLLKQFLIGIAVPYR